MFAVAQTLALNSRQADAMGRVHRTRMFTNDVDQVGGPHQFWQTTPSRDKERFMLKFYDQQFPSHNKSARCAKARPAVSTMRRPPGTAKHRGMEDRNNEAQLKLCLECI